MNIAIILASGKGKRFGEDKVFKKLCGKELILYSFEKFIPLVDEVFVVIQDAKKAKEVLPKNTKIISGGKTRFESSLKAYQAINPHKNDILIFHNSANPCPSKREILECIDSAKESGSAGVAHKISNTVRRKNQGIINRKDLYLMETPQALRAGIFAQGLDLVDDKSPTDDLMLAEIAGYDPAIITASPNNHKITYPEDFEFFERLFDYELQGNCLNHQINPYLSMGLSDDHECVLNKKVVQKKASKDKPNGGLNKKVIQPTKTSKQEIRGIGQDSHRFSSSGKCVLGGMVFSEAPKLEGNSDGDACFHALTNAILSAIGESSLSSFADEMCLSGAKDSKKYLQIALEKMQKKCKKIAHISISFECARPKLEKSFPEMRKTLADLCGTSEKNIGLTATSGEGLTAFGRGEGVQVFALVSLFV